MFTIFVFLLNPLLLEFLLRADSTDSESEGGKKFPIHTDRVATKCGGQCWFPAGNAAKPLKNMSVLDMSVKCASSTTVSAPICVYVYIFSLGMMGRSSNWKCAPERSVVL